MDVLVGDVGGTNARFAVARIESGRCDLRDILKYENDRFDGFANVLAAYLADIDNRPALALFALAGAPQGRKLTLTNRPWTIDAERLEAEFGFESVSLVNDFTAMARSIPEMPDAAFQEIKSGDAIRGEPTMVIGPGTGLGVATLVGGPDIGWEIIGGEGGHGAFSPRTQDEWALAEVLRRTHPHVSNEQICGGVGFLALHRAVCELEGVSYKKMTAADVTEAAAAGDEVCLKICRLRMSTLLGVAGDLALANGTKGGVVLAGGVASHLSAYLSEEDAIARFVERGIQRDYMSAIPVKLLADDEAPLVGAAFLKLDLFRD